VAGVSGVYWGYGGVGIVDLRGARKRMWLDLRDPGRHAFVCNLLAPTA